MSRQVVLEQLRSAAPVIAPSMLKCDFGNLHRELARIIVSDVILYNEKKFAAALQAGNVEEAMASDLEEGRALFSARVDSRVSAERDFLRDELIRVARERGVH